MCIFIGYKGLDCEEKFNIIGKYISDPLQDLSLDLSLSKKKS